MVSGEQNQLSSSILAMYSICIACKFENNMCPAVRSEFHCYHGHVEYLVIMKVHYLIISDVEEDTVYPIMQRESYVCRLPFFMP